MQYFNLTATKQSNTITFKERLQDSILPASINRLFSQYVKSQFVFKWTSFFFFYIKHQMICYQPILFFRNENNKTSNTDFLTFKILDRSFLIIITQVKIEIYVLFILPLIDKWIWFCPVKTTRSHNSVCRT